MKTASEQRVPLHVQMVYISNIPWAVEKVSVASLASVLSCFLSSHGWLLTFIPSRDSHRGAELGASSCSPSPLTQKSLSKGLTQKWKQCYQFSTGPLVVVPQVTPQKEAGFAYPALSRITQVRRFKGTRAWASLWGGGILCRSEACQPLENWLPRLIISFPKHIKVCHSS